MNIIELFKRIIKGFILLTLFLFIGVKCERQENILDTPPEVFTERVESISSNSAIVEGVVKKEGGAYVVSRGFCWSTNPSPDIANSLDTTVNGKGAGKFSCTIDNLNPEETYFARAYAINDFHIAYGKTIEFSTVNISPASASPAISILGISTVTKSGATIKGKLITHGSTPVTSMGICWNISGNPTKDDYKETVDITNDEFYCTLEDLQPNTEYYVRGFAENSFDIAYSNEEINFKTHEDIADPDVKTYFVSEVYTNAAVCSGEIANTGVGEITHRGICWNSIPEPTINDNIAEAGNGTGKYSVELIELNPGQKYYVRAYAVRDNQPYYGHHQTFTTKEIPANVIHDGYTYSTIQIDNRIWMAENLRSTHYSDGSNISSIAYDNNEDYVSTYGRLYTWAAAMKNSTINGSQGVCPSGWHIPTSDEWDQLIDYMGGQSIVGSKLKETGYDHWDEPNTGATNLSGFNALPGGRFPTPIEENLLFLSLGRAGSWWSSTQIEADKSKSWGYTLFNHNTKSSTWEDSKHQGFSIRCIKD